MTDIELNESIIQFSNSGSYQFIVGGNRTNINAVLYFLQYNNPGSKWGDGKPIENMSTIIPLVSTIYYDVGWVTYSIKGEDIGEPTQPFKKVYVYPHDPINLYEVHDIIVSREQFERVFGRGATLSPSYNI